MRSVFAGILACGVALVPVSSARAVEYLGNVECNCQGRHVSEHHLRHPSGRPMTEDVCKGFAATVVQKSTVGGQACCRCWCTPAGEAAGESPRRAVGSDLGSTARQLQQIATMSDRARKGLEAAGDRAAALLSDSAQGGSGAGRSELAATRNANRALAQVGDAMDEDMDRAAAEAPEIRRKAAEAMDPADSDRPVDDLKAGAFRQGRFAFASPPPPPVITRKVRTLSDDMKAVWTTCKEKAGEYGRKIMEAVGGVAGDGSKSRAKMEGMAKDVADTYVQERTNQTMFGRVQNFGMAMGSSVTRAFGGFKKHATATVEAFRTGNNVKAEETKESAFLEPFRFGAETSKSAQKARKK